MKHGWCECNITVTETSQPDMAFVHPFDFHFDLLWSITPHVRLSKSLREMLSEAHPQDRRGPPLRPRIPLGDTHQQNNRRGPRPSDDMRQRRTGNDRRAAIGLAVPNRLNLNHDRRTETNTGPDSGIRQTMRRSPCSRNLRSARGPISSDEPRYGSHP